MVNLSPLSGFSPSNTVQREVDIATIAIIKPGGGEVRSTAGNKKTAQNAPSMLATKGGTSGFIIATGNTNGLGVLQTHAIKTLGGGRRFVSNTLHNRIPFLIYS